MFVRKWIKKAERGDVVVFRYPENPSVDFVKRVVAVGGDDIEVLDGRPSVNGKLARQCYVGPFTMEGRTQELYLERLGDRVYGVLHTRKIDEQTCSGSEGCASPLQCHQGLCVESVQGPWRVPQNELWVLGDNRDNSHDSRMWSHGEGRGVPLENVIGQPSFLFFSQAQGRAGKDVGGPPLLGGNQSSLAPELEKCVTELSR